MKCHTKDGVRYDGCMSAAARGPEYCTCNTEQTNREGSRKVLRFFVFAHLPAGPLQDTSAKFAAMAQELELILPDGEEKSECFRKLLEAKDCAVRAMVPE